ncbi:MAG: N-6 DNA methylase [Bacteroidales bacterium]|nr:N-6 DNA methylase [Bacteroidales bacterium]
MTIQEYLHKINDRYKLGIATEHTYRGDLQSLLETLAPGINVTNEPSRIECGAPDYILSKGKIPVGYIEAKDVGKPLDSKEYKEQFDRYKKSLENLIITDYLDFQLFVEGQPGPAVRIADIERGRIVPRPEKYSEFEGLIKNFSMFTGQTIKSPAKLSMMMAAKAKLLASVIENAITKDVQQSGNLFQDAANKTLRDQLEAFRQILIHDITEKDFADIYAQTIAYGMFAARLHDPSLVDFSRQEAAELIPQSNPFLRKLFQYIAGYDLDDRIRWIVDDLADIFRATDVAVLLKDFGKATQQHDPIIHFYETFLSEYNPALRKSRGVWYTPEPVVNFIVRAVDDILKDEFGLPQGLADTSKIKVKTPIQGKMVEQEVHRVQVLDPACGTGTFLAEVVRQIHKKFEGQEGIWNQYIEDHLLPRLNGFEILMASYAMAHLKLELLLQETGYRPTRPQRLKVYLTNSLEEHHQDTGTLFVSWLSQEADEANQVKRDTPVMVVLGNPPYSVSSSNKGEWIQNLIADFKKDLREKKINLDDDYIKFTRYGEYFIEKNGEGILAFISNNSFIDGVTHRQMRKHLLETFDKIFILNLHGNSNIKETCPNGEKDENVFDIQQGVSINLFVKNNAKKKKELAQVFHFDLFGTREVKYDFLSENTVKIFDWKELDYKEPYFFFVPKDFTKEDKYFNGFCISSLFQETNSGIQTKIDRLAIHFRQNELLAVINDFKTLSEIELKNKYQIIDTSGWSVKKAKQEILSENYQLTKILYRPFDIRYTIFTGKSGGFIGRSRNSTMKHFLKENLGIIFKRSRLLGGTFLWRHIGITNLMSDLNYLADQSFVFPLYLYLDGETDGQKRLEQETERTPNLNLKIVDQIAEQLGLSFTYEKETTEGTFAPIDLLDYIYAVLHSPTYREKYKEFLKIDFPRIPYPKDQDTFWKLVKLGGELRQIHLLESPVVEQFITSYPISGSNGVGKVRYDQEKVWINDNQYFNHVPQIAWEFYIGGYQPAQKWLKDRKGRQLSFEDVRHYQKIIVALTETDRIMKEIDKIDFE